MANPWDNDPIVTPAKGGNPWDKDPIIAKAEPPGILATAAGALGKGFGSTMLGAQKLVGKGLSAVGGLTADAPTLTDLVTGSKPTSMLAKAGKWLQDDANQGQAKLTAELAPYKAANPTTAAIGETGGEIIATLPVGGVLGAGVKAALPVAAAARAAPLINAISSSGMRTGLPAATTLAGKAVDLGARAIGGGITAGASGELIDPDHAGTTALVGAALPGALKFAGAASGFLGRTANALVQPFTQAGQEGLAAGIIRRFGEGGPMAVNAGQIVPGSAPTLAEATGNAGIAGLQRTARDLRPNAFVGLEKQNSAARNALFDTIAGNKPAIELAQQAREQTGNALYGKAFAADAMRQDLANSAQAARAPFAGVGLSGAREDLATPGLRELMSRPMFQQAAKDARQLAANNGVDLADPTQSLQGLHYIKLALDDALNPAAKSAMGRNASGAVMGMRNKLEEELAKVSPLYGNARTAFADMSKPINAMEALQGLKLTDAKGNMTLSKVKSALDSLEKLRSAPGANSAKSVTEDQIKTLTAIRDDLLRQDNLGLGKSAGSNTFQNIATDNLLGTMLPGSLGGMVNGRIGTAVGQLGKLAYSGANEKIRNNLVDMMLDPSMAQNVLSRGPTKINAQRLNALADLLQPGVYRAAPALSTSR